MNEATVQFGRLGRRGVLLGLSGGQVGLIGGAMFVVLVAVRGAGGIGLAVAAPLWLLLSVAGLVGVGGRTVPAWIPVVGGWVGARASGRTKVSTVPAADSPGTLVLPGVPGMLEVVPCARLGGVLVVDRRTATVTAIARVHGSGILLDDDAAKEHKASAWGRVLGGLCQQPQIVRVQILTTVAAGGMSVARRWWREHCLVAESGVAATLADLLDEGFMSSARREHFVAVAVRSPRGRRRLTTDAASSVAGSCVAVADALGAAELTVDGWLDGPGLARAVRRAYEPLAASDEVPVRVGPPVGVAEEWDRWCTGTTWHATYWVAEWPRTAVDATFLQPLVGDGGARTVSLIAEPVPAREALRQIRRARAEYRADAAQRQRIGQVEDRAITAEVEDLDRREAELVAGHGDLRFTGLVSVSAPDRDRLADACRAVEADAARAMCDLVRLVGQQGAGHLAASLPLARGVR